MRSWMLVILSLVLTGCPQLASDWTVASDETERDALSTDDADHHTADDGGAMTQDTDGSAADSVLTDSGSVTVDSGSSLADSASVSNDACTPVTHSNGEGQTWTDCEPLGTYDETEAMEACEAHLPSIAHTLFCDGMLCSCDGGSCGDPSEMTIVIVGQSGEQVAWAYTGPSAGHLSIGSCPTGSDPMWN